MALKLKPGWPDCMNNLASLIATHPEIRNRNTDEAIQFATLACKSTGYRNPVYVATLAAAYAAAGRFSEAVDTAKKALSIADATNQTQLKNTIMYHLSFYTQGRPYVDSSFESPPDANKR